MEQHPVPQPITSYEFRLVGDMTIRQFGKLAAGVILALIVYWINPSPGLLKWFLIILFSGLGAGMAFVPFQGRPLDVWIISFFKRIYSPTQYVWRMSGQSDIKPSYEQPNENQVREQYSAPTNHIRNQTPPPKPTTNRVPPPQSIRQTTPEPTSPVPNSNQDLKDGSWHQGKQQAVKESTKEQLQPADETIFQSVTTNAPTNPPLSQPNLPPAAPSKTPPPGGYRVSKATIYSADTPPQTNSSGVPSSSATKTVPPQFNPSLVIPTLPNIANILGGFVKDTDGKLVEGAIIEVKDNYQNPVRAFKTNKLGQFQIATPLPDGTYEIETEKDGLTFDIIKIELKGEIVPPFEIIAKSTN